MGVATLPIRAWQWARSDSARSRTQCLRTRNPIVGGGSCSWKDALRIATYSRLDEGAKVWIEGATLVGLEKSRVEQALAAWG
jgi:hypothetical protein